MSSDPPSFHAATCKRDECDFSTLRSSMVALIGDMEDHFKDDHGVTDEEWREIRRKLE